MYSTENESLILYIYIFLRVTLQYGGLEILIIYLELNHFFFLEKI